MNDWNVVVSIYQDGFTRALRALKDLGVVEGSGYYNVLCMKVDDPVGALEAIERKTEESPALYDAISRVAPAAENFQFQSAGEFEEKAKSILRAWSQRLAGRSFHTRLHRRGARHDMRTPGVEKVLNDAIIAATGEIGVPGRVSFTDPDAVIVVDTVDDRAGIAAWTRDDLMRHRLLRPD